MNELQGAHPSERRVAIGDALASVGPMLNSIGVPTELTTRFLAMLSKIRLVDGNVTYISEEDKETRKHVKDPDSGREITFIFPSAEQLDKDAQSSDQATADKAKKLKRFEKRLDEAASGKHPVRVTYVLPDDFDSSQVSADKITNVVIFY